MEIKFGKTAGDYARHRAGFPEQLFVRLQRLGVGRPGQRVLDLGTGTGSLARGFAHRGCAVTGLDLSADLLDEANRLDKAAGVSVDYVIAAAEETGLPDAAFDVVAAGQCWHWFDRQRAAAEARRVLVPGGRLLIAHFDWLPLPGNVVEATEKLIEQHNPAWRFGGGLGVYPAWLRDVTIAGFHDVETFTFDLDVSYSHEAWRGRVRASAGVAASLAPDAVAAFDAELRLVLESCFADEPLAVPHRVFALLCRAP
jgi:SAM-dependent methyltransferase